MLSAQTAEPEGNLTFTKPGRSHRSHLGGSYAHRSARNIRAPQKPDRSRSIQSQKAFNPTFGQTSRKSSCSPCNTSFLRKESGWPDRKISVADLMGNHIFEKPAKVALVVSNTVPPAFTLTRASQLCSPPCNNRPSNPKYLHYTCESRSFDDTKENESTLPGPTRLPSASSEEAGYICDGGNPTPPWFKMIRKRPKNSGQPQR